MRPRKQLLAPLLVENPLAHAQISAICYVRLHAGVQYLSHIGSCGNVHDQHDVQVYPTDVPMRRGRIRGQQQAGRLLATRQSAGKHRQHEPGAG
jgi:hypothetical protein